MLFSGNHLSFLVAAKRPYIVIVIDVGKAYIAYTSMLRIVIRLCMIG